MQHTPIQGEDGRDGLPPAASAATNERLVRELSAAQAHERTLLFELASAARDLHEKDFLLREAEHRLKNTLQLACGMLQSQARGAGGKDAQGELQAAGARLKAVVDLQFGLHDLGDSVRLDQWLPGVCRAMALNPTVELEVRAPAISVPRASAAPIGLFASEAVCNAMKHAFADGETGQVLVQFAREEEDWRLSVADDGHGGPGQVQPGFGVRMLGSLARQLRGRLELGRGLHGRGLSVNAVFPLPETASSLNQA